MDKSETWSASEFNDKYESGEISYTGKGTRYKQREKVSLNKKNKSKKVNPKDKIDLFQRLIKQELNLDCVREYQFDPNRKWRADYFIPKLNCCVEVEGGAFTQGRHTRGKGFIGDMEKYNRMNEMGFKLIRVIPSELMTKGFIQIERLLKNKNQ